MNIIKRSLALTAAIFVLAIVNINAQTYSGTGHQTGKTIEQQIDHKLLMLTRYGVFDNITYQVNGDTVTLGGKVVSLGTKSEAANSIKRIDGVREVVNNIAELPPSPFDDQIRRNIVRTFANTGGLYRYIQGRDPSVRIIVENGHVTLEGAVSSKGDYNSMNIMANTVANVFSVKNNLVVEHGAG
jgi:hyperosmotically inducible protein